MNFIQGIQTPLPFHDPLAFQIDPSQGPNFRQLSLQILCLQTVPDGSNIVLRICHLGFYFQRPPRQKRSQVGQVFCSGDQIHFPQHHQSRMRAFFHRQRQPVHPILLGQNFGSLNLQGLVGAERDGGP